jgi:hypothetical protein
MNTKDKYIKAKDEELVYLFKKHELYVKNGNEYKRISYGYIVISCNYYKLNPDYKEEPEFKDGEFMMSREDYWKSDDWCLIIYDTSYDNNKLILRRPSLEEARKMLPSFNITEKE